MTSLLKETYGGSLLSPYTDKVYCCYTVYDKERDMYYSGMKSYIGTEHPVGKKYFTSSTVRDFRSRFENNTSNFEIYVEYFLDLATMAAAEKNFHIRFDVGRNPKFYNAMTSSGSFCGKGSVLCKDEQGNRYRVTVEEYKSGKHKHVCKDKMLVYIDNDTTLTSIKKTEFDPSRMKTQFYDHVLCFDTVLKKNRRIPKNEYEQDAQRYVGITRGKCVGINRTTGEKEQLITSQYSQDDYFFNCASKSVKVIDKQTNQIMNIPIVEYRRNKENYRHFNSTYLCRIDLLTMTKRKVSRDEYDLNPNHFADLNAKEYYVVDSKIFGSWKRLTEYLKISLHMSKNKVINNFNIEVKEICVRN